MRNMRPRRARDEARRLLHASGVRRPEHIDVEALARSFGAEVVIGKLDGATARVMRFGTKARIRVSDRIVHPGARRFSIAHELGHLVLGHEIPTESDAAQFLARACTRKRGETDPEPEANTFAAETLMPEWLVKHRCEISPVHLGHVHDIAHAFRTSKVASAVRFAELTSERCAAVYSERGAVKWIAPSATFPDQITRGMKLDPGSIAFDYFAKGSIESDPQRVTADAWLPATPSKVAHVEIVEHSELVPESGGVLSLLWIPEDAAARLARFD